MPKRLHLRGVTMGVPAFQTGDRFLSPNDVLDILVKNRLISNVEAEKLLIKWSSSKENPLSQLSKLPITDRRHPDKLMIFDDVMSVVAQGLGISYQRVDFLKISLEVVSSLLPYAYVDRLSIVPIEVTQDTVVFLTAEPFTLSWVDEVKTQVKRKVEIRLSTPAQIRHILNEMYVIQKAFNAVAKEQGQVGSEKLKLLRQGKMTELEGMIEKSKGKRLGPQDGNVAKIVDWLINFAVMERASDIHLEQKKGWPRLDSELMAI